MRTLCIIGAIVAFSVAAILAFVGNTDLTTTIGIGFVGAALYAASAVLPDRVP